MDWARLLSAERLRYRKAAKAEGRNPFQQDLDRIVFSSPFRRLANKTQVHPLAPNDHVHTRLTHSIEVASVGRSLGAKVGAVVAPRLKDPAITADSFGHIVQAACLAHDIGNPPFGHSGEEAIREWFMRAKDKLKKNGIALSKAERADFELFEGNAQGLRILTQLEMHLNNGGLQLTYAVLGTFAKYPRASGVPRDASYPGGKKMGFFDAERDYFAEIAKGVGLIPRKRGQDYWCRHPLTYLVEAADDICYSIIDIEDGYSLGYLSFDEAMEVLGPIAGKSKADLKKMHPDDAISLCRAMGINSSVEAATAAFLKNEDKILEGRFATSLMDETKYKAAMKKAISVAQDKIYWSDRKTKLELAGAEVIGGLLDMFVDVAIELARLKFDMAAFNSSKPNSRAHERAQALARLMGRCLTTPRNGYEALLCVTDFVSGMTDRYAVDLFQTLKGISTATA
ncbi:MAG: deoxyguanosinetriphosphate triphosphohydrolase [Rhodospirillaceae bacterium]|nr:deoxyguanosinetriphosphate triphosphohydrolase [Rhodospirillaceae bacterium]